MLRRRPLRQRYLRHHAFLGDRFFGSFAALGLARGRLLAGVFAALPAALAVAAGALLAPPRFAAASLARPAANRLAQASAATSADRYRRVKMACPQFPGELLRLSARHALPLTGRMLPKIWAEKRCRNGIHAAPSRAGRCAPGRPPLALVSAGPRFRAPANDRRGCAGVRIRQPAEAAIACKTKIRQEFARRRHAGSNRSILWMAPR